MRDVIGVKPYLLYFRDIVIYVFDIEYVIYIDNIIYILTLFMCNSLSMRYLCHRRNLFGYFIALLLINSLISSTS